MKATLLTLFFSAACFAQTTVQIELANFQEGLPVSEPTASCGSQSNNAGLNAIFQNHNVYIYCGATFTSYPSLAEVAGGLITCGSCDAAALISDLEAYSEVISRARLAPDSEHYANYLYITLDDVVTQTGTTAENVVITTDNDLNPVFQDFTVFSFEPYFGDTYLLKCDCYAPDLAQVLIDQNIIMPNSTNPDTGAIIYDQYFYHQIIYLLSKPDFAIDRIRVFPNPFTELTINTDDVEVQLSLFDITGKLITSCASVSEVTVIANGLRPGLYLLHLATGGNSKTVKIIKQ